MGVVGGPSRYYLNFHIRIVEDNLVLVPQYLLEDNLGTFLLWWSKVAQFSSYSELDTILITSSLNGLFEQVPRGGNEHEAVVGRAGERLHRGKVGHHHRHRRHHRCHRYHHHHHHQSSNHHREILHRSKVGLLIRN